MHLCFKQRMHLQDILKRCVLFLKTLQKDMLFNLIFSHLTFFEKYILFLYFGIVLFIIEYLRGPLKWLLKKFNL